MRTIQRLKKMSMTMAWRSLMITTWSTRTTNSAWIHGTWNPRCRGQTPSTYIKLHVVEIVWPSCRTCSQAGGPPDASEVCVPRPWQANGQWFFLHVIWLWLLFVLEKNINIQSYLRCSSLTVVDHHQGLFSNPAKMSNLWNMLGVLN